MVPDVSLFLSFLKQKMKTTPMVTAPAIKYEVKVEHNQGKKHKAPVYTTQPNVMNINCSLCKGGQHPSYLCPIFKAMDIEHRKIHARDSNLCFNCLSQGHRTRDCKSTNRCKKCSKSHHTMLHREQVKSESDAGKSPVSPSDSSPPNSTNDVALNLHIKPQQEIQKSLSMTSHVTLEEPSGKQIVARALLDSGAGVSLVSQRIVKKLQLQRSSHNISITGAMGTNVGSILR